MPQRINLDYYAQTPAKQATPLSDLLWRRAAQYRVLSVVVLLVVGSLGSGCRITHEAETIVHSDGSVTRTIRYIADEPADKEELVARHVLPQGGVWQSQTLKRPNSQGTLTQQREEVFFVAQYYGPGQSLPPSYVRKSAHGNGLAQSSARVSVHDELFRKRFNYEERFSDVATLKTAEGGVHKVYEAYIEYLAAGLQNELHDGVTIGQARGPLRSILDSGLRLFLHGLATEGVSFFGGETDTAKRLEELLSKERVVEQLCQALPPPGDVDAASWREGMGRVYDDADALFPILVSGPVEEELFGVHGVTRGGSLIFQERLMLPGSMVRTNAKRRTGDLLIWEFGPQDFLFKEYVLRAESQIVDSGRIALLVAILVIGLVLMRFRVRTQRP